MRYLFVTHRHVPLDIADDYLLACNTLRQVVAAAGGRAWVYQGTTHEDRFLEFIEWQDPSTPLDDATVNTARTQLDAFAPPTEAAQWQEAT